MIGCLIALIIVAIVALIVIFILEAVLSMFVPLPTNVLYLIRLLVGLLVLLYAVSCLMGAGLSFPHGGRW